MTWLITWRVAFSQGMRLPLCQIFEVAWIGMRVEMLLQARQARIHIRVSRFEAACHGGWRVGKGEGIPNWHCRRPGAAGTVCLEGAVRWLKVGLEGCVWGANACLDGCEKPNDSPLAFVAGVSPADQAPGSLCGGWLKSEREGLLGKDFNAGHGCIALHRNETQKQFPLGIRFEARSEEHTSELQSLRHLVCR